MIESRFWREELRRDIAWLRAKRTYGRWSEKQMVLYERRLIVVAAQIRVLLDQHRVARRLTEARLACVSYEKTASRPTTLLNRADLFQLFSAEGKPDALRIRDLCNQLLHHYVIFAASEVPKQFTHLLVFSDYLKNERLYEVPIQDLLEFLAMYVREDAGRDDAQWVWNAALQDYKVI